MSARAWPTGEIAATASTSAILRDLHDSINSIGGSAEPRNDHERGMNEAVNRALTIIEAKQREAF